MKTAVCTHDSSNYDFAKDSYIYADWLHVAFYIQFSIFFLFLFCVCVFHSVTLLGFCSNFKNQPLHTDMGVLGNQGGIYTARQMTKVLFFKKKKMFLLVSQCSKNVSNSCACFKREQARCAPLEVCKQSTYIHNTKRGVT